MHVLSVTGVSFELSNNRKLFNNLNFSLSSQLTALVGPNGIGKTCLAKLLAGELDPTQGTVHRNGSVVLFPQSANPEPVTISDYLSHQFEWSILGEQLLKGIDPESLCSSLSGGEWMRVRLARTLNTSFLILDEPTNNLDRQGREALLQFLRTFKGGVLLISHDRECLELCEQVLEISNKGLTKFSGRWRDYLQAREVERQALSRDLEVAKHVRDTLVMKGVQQRTKQEKRNRQGARAAASGGMPKILLGARIRQAQATTGKIDSDATKRSQEAVQSAHNALSELKIEPIMYADLMTVEIPAQKLIVEARAFNVRFKEWLYKADLNFVWRGPVRIAIKGSNGSGKSTLLKAILKHKFESRGELRTGNLETLYIDQQCKILNDEESILENVRADSTLSESELRTGLAKFLFTKDSVFQKVGTLSGGERLRAALAKGLLSHKNPELLLLDEPTNNLDLVNIEFLEKLLREFRGALILISHDEVFLKNCEVETYYAVFRSA